MSEYLVLVIDGPYLAHRSLDAPYKLTTKDGRDSTMMHSFMRSLRFLYKKFNPENLIITWESHDTPSWRRQIQLDYKPFSTPNKDYIEQVNDLKKLLYLLNIKQYFAPQNEADDVIASVANKINRSLVIFTTDKDILQTVNDEQPIHVFRGKTMYDEAKVVEKFGILPYQIADYLAIKGDTCDNIHGINGLGTKKTEKLLNTYGLLDMIPYDEFPQGKIDYGKAKFNKTLTVLNTDAPIKDIYPPNYVCNKSIDDILDKYELNRMKENISTYKIMGDSL